MKLTRSCELSKTGLLLRRKKRCNRSEQTLSSGWPTLKESSIKSSKLKSSHLQAVTNVSARLLRMVSGKGMNSSLKSSKTSRISNQTEREVTLSVLRLKSVRCNQNLTMNLRILSATSSVNQRKKKENFKRKRTGKYCNLKGKRNESMSSNYRN